MGLTAQAIADVAAITSNANDFGVSISLIAPNAQTATVIGLHTKHHLGLTAEGAMINSKKASVSISENVLASANSNYPIRNSDNEVTFKDHLVNVSDSTGVVKNYIASEWYPDEKVGLIVLILEDYE